MHGWAAMMAQRFSGRLCKRLALRSDFPPHSLSNSRNQRRRRFNFIQPTSSFLFGVAKANSLRCFASLNLTSQTLGSSMSQETLSQRVEPIDTSVNKFDTVSAPNWPFPRENRVGTAIAKGFPEK